MYPQGVGRHEVGGDEGSLASITVLRAHKQAAKCQQILVGQIGDFYQKFGICDPTISMVGTFSTSFGNMGIDGVSCTLNQTQTNAQGVKQDQIFDKSTDT